MPVIHAPSAPTHEIPGASFTSLATPTVGSTETSVWKVEIAPGTPAIPHELTKGEVFVVLGGIADVVIGAEHSVAVEGDVIIVPPHTSFELRNGGTTVLSALCAMPTDGQARIATGDPFTPPWAL